MMIATQRIRDLLFTPGRTQPRLDRLPLPPSRVFPASRRSPSPAGASPCASIRAFWHGQSRPLHFRKLGTYWDEKADRTQQRDRDQEAALRSAGYHVVRFWDFDVKADADGCAAAIADVIDSQREPHRNRPSCASSKRSGRTLAPNHRRTLPPSTATLRRRVWSR